MTSNTFEPPTGYRPEHGTGYYAGQPAGNSAQPPGGNSAQPPAYPSGNATYPSGNAGYALADDGQSGPGGQPAALIPSQPSAYEPWGVPQSMPTQAPPFGAQQVPAPPGSGWAGQPSGGYWTAPTGLPGYAPLPAPTNVTSFARQHRRRQRLGSRKRWLLIALAVAVAAGGSTAGFLSLNSGPSADARYLRALRGAGLGGQFSSDAVAIAHGRAVCNALRNGGKPQGSEADLVAVNTYCAAFASGFHVLEHADVQGTFVLYDSTSYSYGSAGIYSTSSGSCTGANGYDDIGPGTEVVVKDDSGKTLTTTTLGEGNGTDYKCSFEFEFSITEGSTDYVVSVSHRGEQHYTFTRLQNDGVHLTLGD